MNIIEVLVMLSKFLNKNFKDMTRAEIIQFLDKCRRSEAADALHKWIGTYNYYRSIIISVVTLYCLNKPNVRSLVNFLQQLRDKYLAYYLPL
jgi:hypothetical protein